MTKKKNCEWARGFIGSVIRSQARSAEVMRVAKVEYDRTHAEVVKKLASSGLSKKRQQEILRSLKSKVR